MTFFCLCMMSNTFSYASGSDLWCQLIWGGGGNAAYKTLKCPLAELSFKFYQRKYTLFCRLNEIHIQGKLFHSKALIATNVEILSGSDWWRQFIWGGGGYITDHLNLIQCFANTQILVTYFKSVPKSYMPCLKDVVSNADMALSFRSAQPKCMSQVNGLLWQMEPLATYGDDWPFYLEGRLILPFCVLRFASINCALSWFTVIFCCWKTW